MYLLEQDATNGYLKLLVMTAAEGGNAGVSSKRFDHQMNCDPRFPLLKYANFFLSVSV
jgi:hypothetical protein